MLRLEEPRLAPDQRIIMGEALQHTGLSQNGYGLMGEGGDTD